MEILVAFIISSFLLLIFFVIYWIIRLYNSLHELREPIRSADATLNSSLQRKSNLSKELINIAERVADNEKSIHHGIANEITKAAELVSESNMPSLILANLANRFPELRLNRAFETAQQSSVFIEDKISQALEERNSSDKLYKVVVQKFPANMVAGILGFSPENYREDAQLTNPAIQNTVPHGSREDLEQRMERLFK